MGKFSSANKQKKKAEFGIYQTWIYHAIFGPRAPRGKFHEKCACGTPALIRHERTRTDYVQWPAAWHGICLS